MRLFDLHCDTLYACMKADTYLHENTCHVDLKRGSLFDRWIQVFAAWLPDTLRGEAAWLRCQDQLEFAHAQAAIYPAELHIIRNAQDMAVSGGCGCILSVEGGAALAGNLAYVEALRALDVRILTLTWNGSNEWGHGAGSPCKKGLTPFGKQGVRALETAGIVVDVSHLNEQGFWDVAELAKKPFIASHSLSRTVYGHARNLTDDQFRAVRDSGGVVGVSFCEAQLGEQSFPRIRQHVEHYLSLSGEHTVAFGGDLDGTDVPDDWNGIAVMERLYTYFLRKNYQESLLDRLFFGNCYDFFARVLTK